MRAIKLSERAVEILVAIDQASVWNGDTRPGTEADLIHFYVPERGNMGRPLKLPDGREITYYPPHGADASIFRSLERKGLIQLRDKDVFWAVITEEGMVAIEDIFFPCECHKGRECPRPPRYRRAA